MGIIITKLGIAILKIVILPSVILVGGAAIDLTHIFVGVVIGVGTVIGVILAGIALMILQQVFASDLRDATTICIEQ